MRDHVIFTLVVLFPSIDMQARQSSKNGLMWVLCVWSQREYKLAKSDLLLDYLSMLESSCHFHSV